MDIDEAKAWAVAEFQRKPNTAYHRYQQYLEGKQPLAFATEKYEQAFGRIFKPFAYNICETVVDAHADRMEITGFTAPKGGDDRATKAQATWEANRMDHREGMVESDQFGYGDGYVIVDIVDNQPVIWPGIPTEIRVRYSDQRPGHRIAAARLWGEGKIWRLNVWTETALAKFAAPRHEGDTEAPRKPESFAPLADQQDDIPNPVPGIVPVFHFANNAHVNDYGTSELRSVIPLQDALNKTLTDLMVAMEFYAFRQRIILGISIDPNDEAAAKQFERFQMGMTRMMWVDGAEGKTPSIQEFSETNILQYSAVVERYEQQIAIVSKVPRNYFGQRSADAISGESKRMDESQFISKIEDRQHAASPIWSEVQAYALTATGTPTAPGDVQPVWKPAAPISDNEELQLALSRKALGMPLETILKEMGIEPNEIATILKERQKEQEATRRQFDAGFALNGAGEQ